MIIKLSTPFSYARHKEVEAFQQLSQKERVKADRLVMIILFVITIITAVIFA